MESMEETEAGKSIRLTPDIGIFAYDLICFLWLAGQFGVDDTIMPGLTAPRPPWLAEALVCGCPIVLDSGVILACVETSKMKYSARNITAYAKERDYLP